MNCNFKKESFGFIHSLLLTIAVAFSHMAIIDGTHFFIKTMMIWVVGLFPYILKLSKKNQ